MTKRVSLKFKLPKEYLEKTGIDEDTMFETYFENGMLCVNIFEAEDIQVENEYDNGFEDGFDEGLAEGRDDGYLVGYKMGYEDASEHEEFDNTFIHEDDFEDCLMTELQKNDCTE